MSPPMKRRGKQRLADMSPDDYERKIATKEPALFYVFYHGKVTEGEYFDCLARTFPDKSKFKLVRLCFAHGTPLQVFKQASETVKARQGDQKEEPYEDIVWLVFDKDDFDEQNNQYSDAVREAANTDIPMKVAYSNECFELWLLLHFGDVPESAGRKELADRLHEIRSECSVKPISPKHFPFGLLYSHGSRDEAIRRAEELYQKAETQLPSEPWNVNPVTTVHLLVRELERFFEAVDSPGS